MEKTEKKSLSTLVERGGVYYAVPGGNLQEVVSALLDLLPQGLVENKAQLMSAILERETIMSTGVGGGVAIPHPRRPVIDAEEKEFVAIGFLKNGVDWKALDGEIVHAVILMVSSSVKSHLNMLSRVNFLCWKNNKFFWMLERRAAREEIIAAIKETEENWRE